MLKVTECHVSIESPDGTRDWKRCRSLDQVRQLRDNYPTGTIFEIELVDFGQTLYMEITQFGTLKMC